MFKLNCHSGLSPESEILIMSYLPAACTLASTYGTENGVRQKCY